MSIMANYWAKKGWEVTLVTLSDNSSDFYALNSMVKRIGLRLLAPSGNIWQSLLNNIRRIIALRCTIRASRPDVVISFMDRMNIIILLATRGINIPVIISERNDPTQDSIGNGWKYLRKWIYAKSAFLVVQTESVKKWADHKWSSLKVDIIHNPVFMNPDKAESPTPFPSGNWIVSMGRLTEVKGFDLLLKAFHKLKDEFHAEWHLAILGEGVKRDDLVAMVKSLGMEKDVWMPGRVRQPERYLQNAAIFVMSSRHEGFPNALLEAMACGLPVISFDCPSGPREIIHDGVDGILVPPEDVNALGRAMHDLMTNSEERQRLGRNAMDVRERFGVEKIMGQWESLLIRTIDKKSS